MAEDDNKNLGRVAIVGVEGSGKTVMLAGLGDLYKTPDAGGWLLRADDFATADRAQALVERLRAGEWPRGNAEEDEQDLDWTPRWTLRRRADPRRMPEDVGSVLLLDFPGEVYRAAFGVTAVRPETKSAVEQLLRHVAEAGQLVVLVGLRDVIAFGRSDRRVREATWITGGLLSRALDGVPEERRPRAAIALSQADSYADTIAACGGPRGTLARFLPEVAANYGKLDVFALASIDRTDLDDEGNPRPAPGFTFNRLSPLMDWIVAGLVATPPSASRPAPTPRHPADAPQVATPPSASRPAPAIQPPADAPQVATPPSASHRAGDTKTVTLPGGATLELVWCPPGTFTMGSPATEEGRYDGETPHKVTLTQGFWIGKYPVTQRQWASVMGSNPSRFKGDDRPVECVSWTNCQAFCRKAGLGLRLPTEAEWEYACRAGTKTAYFWGNALNGDRANCDGNYPCGTAAKGPYKGETTPVGAYAANAWGLHDMHGNVWEWCADLYGAYPSGAVTDPQGADSGSTRVIRGGCWYSLARYCRSAYRGGDSPGIRDGDLGFRVALAPSS